LTPTVFPVATQRLFTTHNRRLRKRCLDGSIQGHNGRSFSHTALLPVPHPGVIG